MGKEELLRQCRFFRGGGDEEADEAYTKSYNYLVCWTGEWLWVRNDGIIAKDQEEMEDIVSEITPVLPLSLRVYLCESFMHFGNSRLFYEDRPSLVKALRDEIFPFYMASQVIS